MGDPLSVGSALIAVITATVQSSNALYQAIQSFKNHQTAVKQLTHELIALTTVLRSLSYHVEADENPFLPLQFPLRQCCQACKDFNTLIMKCTTRSGRQKTSFRDWTRLSYMKSDIAGFTDMLAGYKSTINIALGDATLRSSRVTLDVLNEYKDMIYDTKHDLERNLGEINSKLQSLTFRERDPSADAVASAQRIQGDKNSTERCIDYCRQLLTQINTMQFRVVKVEPSSEQETAMTTISPQSVTYPDALTLSTLKDCSTRISDTLNHLEAYKLTEPNEESSTMHLDPELDRQRLQSEASSIRQRLEICETASGRASKAKVHVLEDISVGNDSSQMCVSTLGDLFKVKRARAGHGSLQFFGSTSESVLSEIIKTQSQGQYIQNNPTTDELDCAIAGAGGNLPAI